MGSRFKRLDGDNWLVPDPLTAAAASFTHPDEPLVFVNGLRQISLSKRIPQYVIDLFDTGKAAMIYGQFYYPLFYLGLGELLRAMEAAAAWRCIQQGMDHQVSEGMKFFKRIQWLSEQGIIAEPDVKIWHLIRAARNDVSHAKGQATTPPEYAVQTACGIARLIEALFHENAGTPMEPCRHDWPPRRTHAVGLSNLPTHDMILKQMVAHGVNPGAE